jgi:hypothetical protein
MGGPRPCNRRRGGQASPSLHRPALRGLRGTAARRQRGGQHRAPTCTRSARCRAVGITPEMPVAESEQGSRPIRSGVREPRSALPDHAWSSSQLGGSLVAAFVANQQPDALRKQQRGVLAPFGLRIIRQCSRPPRETAECVAKRSRRAGRSRDRDVAEAMTRCAHGQAPKGSSDLRDQPQSAQRVPPATCSAWSHRRVQSSHDTGLRGMAPISPPARDSARSSLTRGTRCSGPTRASNPAGSRCQHRPD